MNSSELMKLALFAKQMGAQVFIDYQRKLDPQLSENLKIIQEKVKEGYHLDHVSVYSCDAR